MAYSVIVHEIHISILVNYAEENLSSIYGLKQNGP
jgi:hypothetical protein